jgi:hypothetical protein
VGAPLREVDAVLLADAPAVSDEVGEAESVVEPLTVVERVAGGVAVPLPVAVAVDDPVPVCVGVPVLLRELDPVLHADAPAETRWATWSPWS